METRLLQLLLFFLLPISAFATLTPEYVFHTLQVGQTITIKDKTYSTTNYDSNLEAWPTWQDDYDHSVIEVTHNSNSTTYSVKGLRAGSTTYIMIAKNWASTQSPYYHVFTVIDVKSVSIPANLGLTVGDSFTYTPIITDVNASTTFTWASSNESVVTVNGSGVITAMGIGKSVITCTAANGISAQSIVTITPLLVQTVSLNTTECELDVNGTILLSSTIAPTHATSKTVNWLSTNDNIAQVDKNGKVTAISPGYCSIYAKADDGSGKFAKCLIHVTGTAGSRSDVNGDGVVTVTDAEVVIDEILSQP